MKKNLLFLTVFITSLLSAQSEDYNKLQSQIDANKTKIETLQSSVNAVTTENIYLKEVLDIQKPIKEASVDNTNYKVISVKGDREKKTVTVEILAESTNYDKKFYLNTRAYLVDILGNSYRNSRPYSKNIEDIQYKNVPLKLIFVFENIINEAKFIKIIEVDADGAPINEEDGERYESKVQFRDLPIDWK